MQLPRATRLVVVGRGASYHGDAGNPAYSPSYQPEGDGAYPPYSGSPGYGGHHSGDEPPKIGFALTLRQGPPATVSSVGGLWCSVALGGDRSYVEAAAPIKGARAEEGQGVGCWERWRVGT
jgi:hypothetical protein